MIDFLNFWMIYLLDRQIFVYYATINYFFGQLFGNVKNTEIQEFFQFLVIGGGGGDDQECLLII